MSASVKGSSLDKTEVSCFDNKHIFIHKGCEYDRQLHLQERAINNMTVDKYLKGRGEFTGKKNVCDKQEKVSEKLKVKRNKYKATKARKNKTQSTANLLQKMMLEKGKFLSKEEKKMFDKGGLHGTEVKEKIKKRALKKAEKLLKSRVALHNPDMIAGGADILSGRFGDSRVNSSIGPSWKGSRIQSMDAAACAAKKEGKGNETMNVKLSRCSDKCSCRRCSHNNQ